MIFIFQFQNPNIHKWAMKTFPLHPPIQPQGSILGGGGGPYPQEHLKAPQFKKIFF